MSIEVQRAPKISQIGLDRSENDLLFGLDESGVITTKKAHSKPEIISKNKEPISKDKIQDMAENYSDYYDSYDEDFEDEGPERSSSKREPERTERRRSPYLSRDYTRSDISVTPPRRTKRNTDPRRNSLMSYRSAYGNSRASKKPSKKKTKKTQSASTRTVKTEETSNMVQRILSANRNKITKLYNTVEDLQHEVDNLRQENKTLKRLHVKQEKELKQMEKAEASLPQLLHRHSAELRTYRERLKKTKGDMTKKEKESHNNDMEITKLRDKVQHYKSLDNDKKLEERAALTRKLEKVDKALSEKDKRIMDLQKTITLAEKGRQREIKEQQERHKKAAEQLKNVREQVAYLQEKLKEKEKMLDNANVYYQSNQKRLKKTNPLALPPVKPEDLHSMKDYESTASHSDKKRSNIFITNGPSDSSSVTAESEVIKRHLGKEKSVQNENEDAVEKLVDTRLREVLEREERRRKEEEDARKREEELKKEQEEDFERMRQMKKRKEEERKRLEEERRSEEEERKRQEEEKKRREEERRKEEEMFRKKREEEERIRKEKEEQARLKFKEDEETRRKKDLLLARMKAIDQTTQPNGIIDVDLGSKSQDDKPKKLPIFLQSSEKPKETPAHFRDSRDNEKPKNGSSTSVRSKHSQSSSYDFKETIQNLHHGLPAHPADQHLRTVAVKGQKDGLGDDELVFGSYKPSVGKHDTKKSETFGSYNPSFTEPKDTGLDFSKKHERKVTSPPKDNDLVFGSYQPTFGAAKGSDGVDGAGRRGGRRGRTDIGQKSNSIFGDDFLSDNKPKDNNTTSLFNEGSFSKSNDKSYPWEKKVNVAKQSVDESLLPRRQKIQQGLNKGHEQNVPAVRNVLNDTIDDDIEEVTL